GIWNLGFGIRNARCHAVSPRIPIHESLESRIPNPESQSHRAMREALVQSLQNLRANKLRSFLTMFGILWGMISVVVLSATGEGFRQGNDKVLRELGKNIGIIWGGRTSLQAGGERAGRRIRLTLDDARAIAAESSMIAVVTPELERAAVKVKSAFNSATARVSGIEPQYQDI